MIIFKKHAVLVMATLILFSNCSKKNEDSTPPPVANFSTASVGNNSNAPSTINFTNTSSGATTYLWNFGDGTNSTSNDPSHKYSNGGMYSVTLTATIAGKSSTKTQTLTISPAYTKVKIVNLKVASTTESSSFTAFFRFTDISGGANLYQTATFTLDPASLPKTWSLTTPYTFLNLSATYYVELWKSGTFSNTRIASGPFLPSLYNLGTSSVNSYPISVTSLDGLSFGLQWE